MRYAPYPLTLRQLQYIVAIADEKSFRKAAERCHVAQPSLSAQVAQVEELLEVQLFERDKKQVVLTPAGSELVARARKLLAATDELIDGAARHADPFVGTLRLGVIPTVGPYLLPEISSSLRRRFPKLTFVWVEAKTAALHESLLRGELDGAVLALGTDVSDLARVQIGVDPFVFAASPRHRLAAASRPVGTDELDGEPVLVLDDGHCFREQALSYCSRAGAEEAAYRATSLSTLVQIAASGVAVTLLPTLAIPVENTRKDLALRAFAKPVPSRTLGLVFRKKASASTALLAVGDELAEAYAALIKRIALRTP
jgi:LysR family transcriptional regulator, hydrogen peroxide-inducible genes activator